MRDSQALDTSIQRRNSWTSTLSVLIILILSIVILGFGLWLFFRANETLTESRAILASLTLDETSLADGVVTTRELEEIASRVEESEARALDYLSLYEALAFALTLGGLLVAVVGAVATTFGLRNYNEIVDELNRTRKKYEQAQEQIEANEQESAQTLETLRTSRSQIEQTIQNALRQEWERSHLALSLIPLAERQYQLGNVDGALATYERVIELDVSNPVPYYYQGYILTQKNRLDSAEQALRKALTLDTEFLHAQAALGYTLRRLGEREKDPKGQRSKYAEAEKMLKQALLMNERLVDADGESWYGSLAGLYKRRGDIEQAEFYYKRAADVTPLSSYPAVNLALIALERQSNEVNQRFEIVERLARLKTLAVLENYWGYGDLLMAQLALGKNTEATDTLRLLIDVIPEGVEDVIPRVHASIQSLRDAQPYPGDRRDTATIDSVLRSLEAGTAIP